MLRKSSKRQRSLTIKPSHTNHTTTRKEDEFKQLINEINNFKDKVLQLSIGNSKTPSKKKSSIPTSQCCTVFSKPPKCTHDIKFCENNRLRQNSQYSINADIPNINVIINNGSKCLDIKQLSHKVRKLQKTNEYLSKEKIFLENRLLLESEAKKELAKLILNKSQLGSRNMTPRKTFKKSSSSSVKKKQALTQNFQKPSNHLEESRQSQINGWLKYEPERTSISSSTKKQMYYSRANQNYKPSQKQNYLKLDDDYHQHTFSTIKTTELTKPNLNYSAIRNSKISNPHKISTKFDQSLNSFQIPQDEHQYVDQPRITFSKQGHPPISLEVNSIQTRAEIQKLLMMEQYFQRLIKSSRLEKDKQKKDMIRKEMSQIAMDIHRLRNLISQQVK